MSTLVLTCGLLILGAVLVGHIAEDLVQRWPVRQPPPALPVVTPHRRKGGPDGYWRC